ncbi:MAG: hypothetical protein HON33_01640 [Flavobacteriaceae bacterium]|jgi:hypothetical protein|nr:hypothetical protein [Flavobacteriaceae bacterium]MBT4958654.1 hypothetical protein [Flavobacteriaceae bacterium]MBT6689080.1 hypothetical protein [Flavobacteriaceae bacterium]
MNITKKTRQAAKALAGLFSVPFGKKVEKFLANIIDDKATIYDVKIDEFYNKTHIGGGTHRHFDGSHTPIQMWEKVKETLPNDTNIEELKNYFLSLFKDLQTPMGIPLQNINNKEAFDQIAAHMTQNFAIKKSWLLDFQSVNLSEIFGATLGVVALFFGWKKNEKEEFADLASSLILAGAVSANPFLFVISLVSWAKSYTKNKDKKKFKKGTIRGFLGMGSFIMTASLFSSPLLGIIVGLIVLIVVKKSLKKIDLAEIYDWFKNQFNKYGSIIYESTGMSRIAKKIGIF